MKPKFKIGKEERLVVSPEWISNGHWMLRRSVAEHVVKTNAAGMRSVLRPILNLKEGNYRSGMAHGPFGVMPDMAQVLEDINSFADIVTQRFEGKEHNFKEMSLTPCRATIGSNNAVMSYVYQADGFEVGLDPKYTSLLDLATKALVKSPTGAIHLFNVNELIALVMPRKL